MNGCVGECMGRYVSGWMGGRMDGAYTHFVNGGCITFNPYSNTKQVMVKYC